MLLNVIMSTRVFIMSRLPTVCLGDADVSGKGGIRDKVTPETMDCLLDAQEGQGWFVTIVTSCNTHVTLLTNLG